MWKGLRLRWVLVALPAFLALSLGPGIHGALAAPVSVTIDDLTPDLAEQDGGGWTANLGFTNLTDRPITLAVVSAAPAAGCELTLDEPQLSAAAHSDVKVTVPAGCNTTEQRVAFTLTAEPPSSSSFEVSAAPAETDDQVDWDQLLVFPITFVLLSFGSLLLFGLWKPPAPGADADTQTAAGCSPGPTAKSQATSTGDQPVPPPAQATPSKPGLKGSLEYLGSTYSFKDSWASNVTAAGALLTGIFGSSDVVKAAIGEDADSSIALATIGAAVALAFIAAGPIVPLAMKSKDNKNLSVIGLLLASVVTLTGAVGQLYIMYRTGEALELGWLNDWLFIPTIAAFLLLGMYAVRTLIATLNEGVIKPAKVPSDAVEAATLIVKALQAKQDVDTAAVEAALHEVELRYPGHHTSPGDESLPRLRVSAL